MSRIGIWVENQVDQMKQNRHALQTTVAQAAISGKVDELPENIAVELAKLEGAIEFGEKALLREDEENV